jgi:hypothetical protein
VVVILQILPLRLSAPPLKSGEADFNKKSSNPLNLHDSTPSLEKEGLRLGALKKELLLIIPDIRFIYFQFFHPAD